MEEVRIIDSKVGKKPLVIIHNETIEIIAGQQKPRRLHNDFISVFVI